MNDNFNELSFLDSLISLDKDKKINPFLYFLEFMKATNLTEIIEKLLSFVLWVNVNKTRTLKRLNNWELILRDKMKNTGDKKKKASYHNKVKKLNEITIKK